MPEILSTPDDLSLAGNLKKFEIRSDSSITFELRDGADTILSQSYDPSPDDIITVDVRDIVEARLSYVINDASDIYEQPGLVKSFTAVISGKEYPFRAIRSGVDRFQDSAATFLSGNFLTWQPQSKKVTYYSPEYLTYYAVAACTLVIEAHFPDGTSRRVENPLSAGRAYTANLQYARIVPRVGGSFPGYYDVFVEDRSGNRLSYVQRYIISDIRSEGEEWILFENTLGGLDTLRAYGSYDHVSDNTHNIAEIDERSLEYRTDVIRKFNKNTGYLDNYERRWILDFFPSKGKYIITSGSLRQIVVRESTAEFKSSDLPSSYTFTFSYADARPLLNLSRTPILPKELHIESPDQQPLPVPPRLAEFPGITLSDGVMIPVQGANSASWSAVSLAALKNYLKVSGITGNFLTVDGDASNTIVTFETAAEAGSFNSGDKLSVLFGQIKRWFSDLVTGHVVVGNAEDAKRAERATKDEQGNVIHTTYATKTEVDQRVTGVYKFQGSVQNVAALLALTGVKRGDVYDVREAGTLNGEAILPGDNVAATADNPTVAQWDKLAGKVDLSGYLQKNGDASNTIVTFEPETGEPASGASLHSIIGRLVKKVTDIVSGAIKVAKAAAADTATRAVNDENGRNIPQTYATKGEVTNVQVGARNYVTGLKDNWEGGIVGSDGVVALGNNYNQVTKDYQDIAFLAGKTATVSVNPNAILSGAERLKLSFRIVFYTQDFLFISYSSGDGNTPLSLTVPDDAFYCKASVGLGVYGYVANNFDTVRFQLELGNKATDYRPAPQDIARINGDYPAMKAGKATADGDGNNIKDTYATQKGTYPGLTAGNANMAKNLKSDNNFYLGYDGTDGTGTPFVILGATGTDNYNNSTIKRVKPDSLTVGKATADANGLNIAANYTRRTYVRPGNSWDSVGWYRVYTSGVTNNPGENIDLNLITYYNYDRTQNISLRVCVGYGLVSVVQQNAFFNTPISKIRVVWKGNGTFYIDAYMKDSRGVWVCLNQTGGTGTLAETAILNPAFADGYTATEYTIIAGDRPMQLSEKAKITYSTAEPANPKEGDFWIVPTD